MDLCPTVVLNGIPYEYSKVDTRLKKFANEIRVTTFADISESRLLHSNCRYVIILGTGANQSSESKESILADIRKNLAANVPDLRINDYRCAECKQVIVDGRPMNFYQAHSIVGKLNVKDIAYIASYKSASATVYGENALNGLVEIYLTKKGRRKVRGTVQ